MANSGLELDDSLGPDSTVAADADVAGDMEADIGMQVEILIKFLMVKISVKIA